MKHELQRMSQQSSKILLEETKTNPMTSLHERKPKKLFREKKLKPVCKKKPNLKILSAASNGSLVNDGSAGRHVCNKMQNVSILLSVIVIW